MEARLVTDDVIARIISASKRLDGEIGSVEVVPPNRKHSFNLVDGDGNTYLLYLRQNLHRDSDFSCGVWWENAVPRMCIVRYNGSAHAHRNKIEQGRISYRAYRHVATERYIQAGLKPEGFAIERTDYRDLSGAVQALHKEMNLEDEAALFLAEFPGKLI